ncbi:hypothetical protein PMAYCL1PPCAC_14377, partial [Pristionchus mayeri]
GGQSVRMNKAIIGTRPGEPPFKLKLEPTDHVYLPWTKDSTFITSVTITNPTPKIQMYKIKCTDNSVFRVQTPLGFLDPKASVELKVVQSAKTRPDENKHFLMFLHQVATVEDKNSKKDLSKIWKGDNVADGVTRVQAHFTEPPKKKTQASVRVSKNRTNTKTEGSVEENKSPQRKSSKSAFIPLNAEKGSKMKPVEDKKAAAGGKKKSNVRVKKSSANTKGGKTMGNTTEDKTAQ